MSNTSKQSQTILNLVIMAMLIAVQIVLSRFLSIPTPITKIGFSFLPIAFACKYLGTPQGMVVAGISDLLGAIMFPIGTYYVGFTITAIIKAGIIGLIACKKSNLFTISFGVIVAEIICSICLNTFWISFYYGNGFIALLPSRLAQAAVMIPVQILVLYPLFTKLHDKITKNLKLQVQQ
ncbi:MAG: folate family ECF transporter S component [Clostridia bacterium]